MHSRTMMRPDGVALDSHKLGLIYLLVSALCFSFAGVFAKGVAASSWDVIFWRAAFGLLLLLLWYGLRGGLKTQLRMQPSGIAIAGIAVVSTTAFLTSFKFTSIANVAMIYATVPLLAGLLGWLLVRERVSVRDLIASSLALLGVAIVVQGSIGTGSLLGDGLAIAMAVTMALVIVLFRKFPETPSGGVNLLSCGALIPIAAFFGTPHAVPLHEVSILALFAFLFILAYITLQEGSKILPPALTGLLSILETPLAPIWAWLILSEVPLLSTLVGGAVIVLAVLTSVLRVQR